MIVLHAVRIAVVILIAAFAAPACQRAMSPPSANPAAADFHYSDPKTIATTGRPQLLEFVAPT